MRRQNAVMSSDICWCGHLEVDHDKATSVCLYRKHLDMCDCTEYQTGVAVHIDGDEVVARMSHNLWAQLIDVAGSYETSIALRRRGE